MYLLGILSILFVNVLFSGANLDICRKYLAGLESEKWYCNCPSAVVLYSVLYSCTLKILERTHVLRNTSTYVFNTFKTNQITQCSKLCNCLRVCAGGKACSSFHSCIGSFALTIVCRRTLTEKLFILSGIYAPLSCWYRLSCKFSK